MIIKKEVLITPFNLSRMLHIYVPDGAFRSKKRYPVMYMFDGHNLFDDEEATYGKSWGLKEWLDENKMNLIIVGIECNHEGNERLSEFSPYDFIYRKSRIKGKGKQLMKWVCEELKPLIDQELPTLPDRAHTAVGGSSMGGLMALYTVLHHNGVFALSAAVSPHIFGMNDALDREVNKTLQDDTRIYISWGAKECRSKQSLAQYSAALINIANIHPGQVYLNLKVEGEHNEASWEREIPCFMNYLYLHQRRH